MAAFVSPARPISQILPGDFDLFPSSSCSPTTSTLKPRPEGHYRRHSTLYSETPYIEEEEKPVRVLKRASSFGGLQKMNLGLSLKPRKNVQSPTTQLGTSTQKVSPPQRLPKTIAHVTKRPVSPLPSLRKKRSMISLFSIASDPLPTDPLPSPLGARQVLIPPSIPEHSTPKSSPPPRRRRTYDPTLPPFVPKSVWAKGDSNMKEHPYQGKVPYMQAYNHALLESDRYSDLLLQRLSKGSPSFTDFNAKPPSTALDLGCGEGHWVVYASTIWKETQITGFDLVDITTPAFKSTKNVQFVQGDFVRYKLPFPDNSFDYVRMANLLLCVPFHYWDRLLFEVRRVMTDKGRLEVIDDQLVFPYGRTPTMKERPSSFANSSDGSDNDNDLDGDTLHGYGSGEDSTFNSEGTCVSSLEDEPGPLSSLPTSETVRPISRSPSPSLDTSEKVSVDAVKFGEPDARSWDDRAVACRQLETAFQQMLLDHELIPHPSQCLNGLIKLSFGKNSGKTKTFHVKLAEWTSPIGPTKTDVGDPGESKENSIPEKENNVGIKKKPWSTTKIDWDKKKSKKKDEVLSVNDFYLETVVPDSVKPKAAKKLGLDITISPIFINPPTPAKPIPMKEVKGKISPPPADSTDTSSVVFPQQPTSSSPVRSNTLKAPNAKMAALLGVSYSELVKAAAQATRPRPEPKADPGPFKPLGLVQSPGLLIDGEYIAVEPHELEMHACKNMNLLLGCRTSFGNFVARHQNEKGEPFVTRDVFADLMWDYENFRRTRLGWPSGNILEHHDDEFGSKEHLHDSPFYKSWGELSQVDEPVPIRSIRIYEGRKADDDFFIPVFPSGSPMRVLTPF